MRNIKELTREERKQLLADLGEKPFREKQLFQWICKGAASFEEMTNLSAALREKLAGVCGFESVSVELVQTSSDGTRKFLLVFPDGNKAEAVFMKYEYGNSVCLSTQVGCNMGCAFCASGLGGKIRNLEAWEIFDQYLAVVKYTGEPVNHVVLMGMGEPLDNYENVSGFINLIHDSDGIGLSLRNITLSTCGLIPKIKILAQDFPQVNLAISLHAATQEAREEIMPVAKKYKLPELIEACREHIKLTGRRITFEYALIKGRNDRPEDLKNLTTLLRGLNCHVNLIPLNPVVENKMTGSDRTHAAEFAQRLENNGIPATVRRQLGADIDAACGQLRKKHTC